jgi:hypothetical protein
MNDETNKKQQRLFEMMENPERFSDQEIESMLHDPEMEDFIRMLALTRRAADVHLNDEADVDQEWQRFAAAHQPRRRFARIAAAIAGGVLVTGLAVAAVVKLEVFSSHEVAPKNTNTPVDSVDAVTKGAATAAPVAKVDTLSAQTKVYDNVALSTILADMAAYYHKEWKAGGEAKASARLYFVWDRRKSLEENVELLNNFNRFEITVEDNMIVVK